MADPGGGGGGGGKLVNFVHFLVSMYCTDDTVRANMFIDTIP